MKKVTKLERDVAKEIGISVETLRKFKAGTGRVLSTQLPYSDLTVGQAGIVAGATLAGLRFFNG